MANRYWNPSSSGNWGDTSSWAETDGGSTGFSVPTSADDVFFTATNTNNCDINVVANCNSLDFSGYSGTVSGSSTLNIYGSITMDSAMSLTYTGMIIFKSTSSGNTITSNGITFNSRIDFDGAGGEWTLQDDLTTTGSQLNLIKGTFDANDFDVNFKTFYASNTNTRTLYMGSGTWTSLGAIGTAFNISTTTNLTFYKGTSTIVINGGDDSNNRAFFGGGLTFYNLTISNMGGKVTIGNANTFNNLSISNGDTVAIDIELRSNQTITGALTINGYSAIKRVLVRSEYPGTQITITSASNTITNADFRDIKGAGAGSWDLSAITGGSGDCGGNTNITFTTADDWYWHEGTGNFSDYSKWYTETNGGGSQMASTRVPLPQDTCYFDANSFDNSGQTITQNMSRFGSIIWTGATNTPTWTTSTKAEVYGSITLISGMTLTNSNQTYEFHGSSDATLTSAGKVWAKDIIIYKKTGKLTLNDDFTQTSTQLLWLGSGTFDANDNNVSTRLFRTNIASLDNTVIMGSGVWKILSTNDIEVWNTASPYTTVTCGTSTIKLDAVRKADTQLSLGASNKIYYNFWNATTGDYYVTIQGSSTFNDFKIDAGRKMKFGQGTTQKVSTFTASGTSGHLITLRSTSTTNATLAKAGGGTISCDYMDVDYITGNPDKTWCMGTHSIDGGHNSQIYFTDPPAANTSNFFQLF